MFKEEAQLVSCAHCVHAKTGKERFPFIKRKYQQWECAVAKSHTTLCHKLNQYGSCPHYEEENST